MDVTVSYRAAVTLSVWTLKLLVAGNLPHQAWLGHKYYRAERQVWDKRKRAAVLLMFRMMRAAGMSLCEATHGMTKDSYRSRAEHRSEREEPPWDLRGTNTTGVLKETGNLFHLLFVSFFSLWAEIKSTWKQNIGSFYFLNICF